MLVRRDERNAEEIADAMGIDKSYLPKLYKSDKLPPKPLKKALEIFHLSENYFDSNADFRIVEEAGPEYRSAQDTIKKLEYELEQLKSELTVAKEEIAQQKSINADLVEAILNLSKRN